ncbi:MAG: STAS domain-containing protein [Gammaproteobacteria bacterium]|nr:STAS domain-containing protein [Gammaproteobacteria bacterium]
MKNIVLQDAVDIGTCDNLHEHMLQALLEGDEISLQADQVKKVDTAGLQLLLVFAQAAKLRGLNVEFHSASSALRSATERIGLSDTLNSLITYK